MNEKKTGDKANTLKSESVGGYFAARFAKGEQPQYGYPKNHVPKVKNASMKVVTGFIAARRCN